MMGDFIPHKYPNWKHYPRKMVEFDNQMNIHLLVPLKMCPWNKEYENEDYF